MRTDIIEHLGRYGGFLSQSEAVDFSIHPILSGKNRSRLLLKAPKPSSLDGGHKQNYEELPLTLAGESLIQPSGAKPQELFLYLPRALL
jgi:hypothetical protein